MKSKIFAHCRWEQDRKNRNTPQMRVRGIQRSRGQSFVEIAILFPILLMLLSGVVEYGIMLNYYLNLLDGVREGARFASDGNPFQRDPGNTNCSTAMGEVTDDFYNQAACLALQVARPITLDPATDDVVISAFGVDSGSVTDRLPAVPSDPPSPGVPASETPGEWHMYGYGGACDSSNPTCHPSRFTDEEIEARLSGTAPNTGILLVEIFYDYNQVLKLPWLTAFVPDPIRIHVYSIMPLVAAEPDV